MAQGHILLKQKLSSLIPSSAYFMTHDPRFTLISFCKRAKLEAKTKILGAYFPSLTVLFSLVDGHGIGDNFASSEAPDNIP